MKDLISSNFFNANKKKGKDDQTVWGIYIILSSSNILKDTAFLHQGVTNYKFCETLMNPRKLALPFELLDRNNIYSLHGCQANRILFPVKL